MTKIQMAHVVYNHHNPFNLPLQTMTKAHAIQILAGLSTATLKRKVAKIQAV